MCSVVLLEDPVKLKGRSDPQGFLLETSVVEFRCSIQQIVVGRTNNTNINDNDRWRAFLQGERVARVALADYISRQAQQAKGLSYEEGGFVYQVETLDRFRRTNRRQETTPFMFERTDFWCDNTQLRAFLRAKVYAHKDTMSDQDDPTRTSAVTVQRLVQTMLERLFVEQVNHSELMNHVAMAVLQDCLRSQLDDLEAVAFIANGAILPRKSGNSSAPMPSPPAVPFEAPTDSPMSRTVEVHMGYLRPYLSYIPNFSLTNARSESNACVSINGLLVPKGVSLIVGGGYHGKSTLLRCIAAGVYNKIPGDGREWCVTNQDAVTVRAEDGRYVNNCNVSAFISNLPTPPGVTKALDTTHFSSGEASGSTSQAANVVEAIEMGASAFLVDEDVSAANFMARDGRMRSLVMDESITPLLYRVNGIYNTLGISSIVVVGGVGDWLDVPNAVILMDKYACKDATSKAKSVSKQFSHGFVQYGGRGVVHRLNWEKSGTPCPRRPADEFTNAFNPKQTAISLLDGNDALSFHSLDYYYHHAHHNFEDEDDEEHHVDLSRCEQLMGRKPQIYGVGCCVVWLLQAAKDHPEKGLKDLLKLLDDSLDSNGLALLIDRSKEDPSCSWKMLLETLGRAYRPRRFEVGQALTRLRGIMLEEIPVEEDPVEVEARVEAERKKQELLDLWNSRRKNKLL